MKRTGLVQITVAGTMLALLTLGCRGSETKPHGDGGNVPKPTPSSGGSQRDGGGTPGEPKVPTKPDSGVK